MYVRAKNIVQKLHDSGYVAYYAGGWVRDFILGQPSDDIDIATSAPPEVIQKLFPHTVPIGAAFGIILVIVDTHSYEVATFRKDIEYIDGRRPSSIEFSTALEDARRRDFTINGMFYDPLKDEVIDYVEGKADLLKKIIRAIGNPHERIKEDRLRMLRAVRLASRFDFEIELETEKAIKAHCKELFPFVAMERIWQELSKMAKYPSFAKSLLKLFEYGILEEIFPSLKGKDINVLEKQLLFVDSFPEKAPPISKLLDLFPEFSLDQKFDLCRYLKLPNEDLEFTQTLQSISNVVKNKELQSDYNWALCFASKNSDLVFKIIAAHFSLTERKKFNEKISKLENILLGYIDRIKKKNPVVKAQHLIDCGIAPGPSMGKLLKAAEEISINEKITDEKEIIHRLRKTPLWEKPHENHKKHH